MADYFKRIKLVDIHPTLAIKAEALVKALEARGTPFYAISGYRSVAEQDGLYAQGRTVLVDAKGNKLPKVTNAKGGQSAHNFRAAIDFCRDSDIKRDGLQPSWKDEDYRILAEEAVKLGLEAGYFWKSFHDAPHIQLPLAFKGVTLAKLRAQYAKGGDKAVQNYLSSINW